MAKKKDTLSLDDNKKSKGGSFKYIVLFALFFIIGTALGIFVGKKFLTDNGDGSVNIVAPIVEEDITNNQEYQQTIKDLKYLIGTNLNFYARTGLNASTLSNEQKLQIVYEYVQKDTTLETAPAFPIYWEGQTCAEGFLVDLNYNDNGTTYNAGICTYYVLPKAKMLEVYKKIFNNDLIEFTEFSPNENYKCVLKDDNYACGIVKRLDYTGEIENHFDIVKVVRNKEDDTITMYERGYLKDTRSFIDLPDDGLDNYYLHASDDTDYYYELVRSENLTFKHTFKKDSTGKYYYVSTVLEGNK